MNVHVDLTASARGPDARTKVQAQTAVGSQELQIRKVSLCAVGKNKEKVTYHYTTLLQAE